MRVPIELVRAILKMNEDYFFLVSLSSVFCFVPLKKIKAIPKGTKKTFEITFHQISIYLPIVGSQKLFELYCSWYTGTNPTYQQYYSNKSVFLLPFANSGHIQQYKYI
jgi:hypothetical protein